MISCAKDRAPAPARMARLVAAIIAAAMLAIALAPPAGAADALSGGATERLEAIRAPEERAQTIIDQLSDEQLSAVVVGGHMDPALRASFVERFGPLGGEGSGPLDYDLDAVESGKTTRGVPYAIVPACTHYESDVAGRIPLCLSIVLVSDGGTWLAVPTFSPLAPWPNRWLETDEFTITQGVRVDGPMLQEVEAIDPSAQALLDAVGPQEGRLQVLLEHYPERVRAEIQRRFDEVAKVREPPDLNRFLLRRLEQETTRTGPFSYDLDAVRGGQTRSGERVYVVPTRSSITHPFGTLDAEFDLMLLEDGDGGWSVQPLVDLTNVLTLSRGYADVLPLTYAITSRATVEDE